MAQFIPSIGLRGYYNLKAPFDADIVEGVEYTCQSVRSYADYAAANEDVLSLIYTPHALTETDYQTDIQNACMIISLQSDSGDWILIPSSYILKYPIIDGVRYHNYMLGVGLGAVPETLDTTALKTLVGDLCYEMYGVRPALADCVLSRSIMISREESDQLEAARLAQRTQNRSLYAQLSIVESNYQRSLLKIAELEAYIKAHYVP